MSYCCDKCGWIPPGEEYFIKNEKAIRCDRDENFKLVVPDGFKVWPRIENREFNMGVAIEFGGNPESWDENHFCPNCKEEFSFSNSNY